MKFKENNKTFLKCIFIGYTIIIFLGIITFILGYYDNGFWILILSLLGITITKYLSDINLEKRDKQNERNI